MTENKDHEPNAITQSGSLDPQLWIMLDRLAMACGGAFDQTVEEAAYAVCERWRELHVGRDVTLERSRPGSFNYGRCSGKSAIALVSTCISLTLTGDCEITFVGGAVAHEITVHQDAVGGHKATFKNVLLRDGLQLSNCLDPCGWSTFRVDVLANGAYALSEKRSLAPVAHAEVATTDGKPFDEIAHARHYNVHPSGVECIEIMERLGANLGTAFKYLWRRNEKEPAPAKDLKKALFYLHRELNYQWERSAVTEARLERVVPHESEAIREAMREIFVAATSETGGRTFAGAIGEAIKFVQAEIERLESLEKT